MRIEGPSVSARAECELILRSLPGWFGDEESLVEYADDTLRLPTFVAAESGGIVGFVTLRQHFEQTWELHCIAVHAAVRGRGIGRRLHDHVEVWLAEEGAALLQVKTMAESLPSPEYAETRRFYESTGYLPLEVFPTLWSPRLPVLQLVKVLKRRG